MNQPKGLLKLLKLDSLIHNLNEYLETRIALVKADAKDDLMKAMRAAMIYGAIAVLAFFFALFLSLTIALALNDLLDSAFWGFAIVTGIYLIGAIILFSLRNSEKVKNMFGDGSLAFLKKQPQKDKNQAKNQEVDPDNEVVFQAPETGTMEHGTIEFDTTPKRTNPSTSNDREPAKIRVEKKEPR